MKSRPVFSASLSTTIVSGRRAAPQFSAAVLKQGLVAPQNAQIAPKGAK